MFRIGTVTGLCALLMACSAHRLPRVHCDGKLEPINTPLVVPQIVEPQAIESQEPSEDAVP